MKFTYYSLIFILIIFFSCNNNSAEIEKQPEEKEPTPTVNKEEDTTLSKEFNKEDYQWEDEHIVIDWQLLSKVDFKEGYIRDTFAWIPIFHDDIKVLEGRPVQITGYFIPFGDDTGHLHIISAYPNSQCFFCGGAGPESVMDIKSTKKLTKLKVDDRITFRGTFKLNSDDLFHLNYILEDAVLVDKKK